jgi:ABC-type nitrate/sulfonate/bicarbonate transport system substrate-binding protein
MQLWYTRCPLPTASGVAIDLGMLDDEFRQDGITVASLNASSDMKVREAHFDHSQANLFRQGGNIPPIWSRSRAADTVLVAANFIDEYQAIVAMPESGLHEAADLRGRRLGLPRRANDSIDYWRAMCLKGFHSALRLAGLEPGDVTLVDLPVEEKQIAIGGASQRGTLWRGGARARRQSREALALVRGEVDAIYTASPSGAHLSAFLGAHTVVDLGAHPDPRIRANNQVPTILTVDGGLARDRPEIVARYLCALLEAARWAAGHRAETLRIISEDVCATTEWVTSGNGEDVHTRLRPSLDAAGIAGLVEQKNFLLANGFIDADFDVDRWVDPRPLAMAVELAAGRSHERAGA